MRIAMRPLTGWPVVLRVEHTKAPFRADWAATRQLLEVEARMLNHQATQCSLFVAVRDHELRADGEVRSTFRAPRHPGVMVKVLNPAFRTLCFYTDQYDTWLGNARAIALTLRQLRAVQRYGVGAGNEAYIGFQEAIEQQGATQP